MGSERLRLMDYLAKSLLMRGKSLCNTALEGDCKVHVVMRAQHHVCRIHKT